jgi:hypothetical protein
MYVSYFIITLLLQIIYWCILEVPLAVYKHEI